MCVCVRVLVNVNIRCNRAPMDQLQQTTSDTASGGIGASLQSNNPASNSSAHNLGGMASNGGGGGSGSTANGNVAAGGGSGGVQMVSGNGLGNSGVASSAGAAAAAAAAAVVSSRSARLSACGVGARVIRGPDWKWGKQVRDPHGEHAHVSEPASGWWSFHNVNVDCM